MKEPDDMTDLYIGPPICEPGDIDVEAYQDVRTGRWVIPCPFCEWFSDGYTAYGSSAQLCEHLNTVHPEHPYGHA